MERRAMAVGVGLRAPHFQDFLDRRPAVDWIEVHTENLFNGQGRDAQVLEQLRSDYPVSLHGVGLGLGSAHGFSTRHLQRVRELVERYQPFLVSEHLCWGAVEGRHLNDLLPMPLTREAVELFCDRVDQVQGVLGRRILIENVSTYLRFRGDAMSEAEFLAELARRTGCAILLDVNNLYVNQCNHGENAHMALHALSGAAIGEIHLAGHLVAPDAVIDHHGAPVDDKVWDLYASAVRSFGAVPTLIEWDTDIPPLDVLLAEAEHARRIGDRVLAGPTAFPLAAAQGRMAAALFERELAGAAAPLFVGEQEAVCQRLALYRGNLGASWTKVLAASYPVLQQLVGEEYFAALARAYGRAWPSQSGNLDDFGGHFPEFLDSHAAAAQYPYLPDMARLERALGRGAAGGGQRLEAAQLQGLAPEALDSMRLRLAHGVELFHSCWQVVPVWHAHRPEAELLLPDDPAGASFAAIVRRAGAAWPLPLEAASFAALSALQDGATLGGALGGALDAALACDPHADFGAYLQQWLQHGLFDAACHLIQES
ncbi:MNIO family bufferin maturase [Massilia sp. SM-13]|uniref:MNIO family bufferin maturase n=1 Tax=Pseudoduganella rhizocola TaxID=3382643 RepID=UPI0038B69DB6